MINDLSALCEAWQPDVLVRDCSEYGACLVGEMLAIPHARWAWRLIYQTTSPG
ncbi:MAG: hypothetical protein M5U34_10080 [Chloroflexi bacterium]|nr:hypothetical protein [Chloroflexota bacterium]